MIFNAAEASAEYCLSRTLLSSLPEIRGMRGRPHSGQYGRGWTIGAAPSSSVEQLPQPTVGSGSSEFGDLPRLQSILSRRIAMKSKLHRRVVPLLTEASIFRRASSKTRAYRSRSSFDRRKVMIRLSLGGRLRIVSIRRKQNARKYSRRGVANPSPLCDNGSRICRSKATLVATGGRRRNAARDERSPNRFWTGVPVKHHRRLVCRLEAARNCFEAAFRIQCAMWNLSDQGTDHTQNISRPTLPSSKTTRYHSI